MGETIIEKIIRHNTGKSCQPGIMSDNLFNNRLAHCLLLSPNPVHSVCAWRLQGHRPE